MHPPPPPWSLRLLGPLALSRGERSVTRFRQQRAGLLLAMLARRPGEAWTRDALMEHLWPEVDPAVGRPRLRVLLAELRGLLDEPDGASPAFDADHEQICLRPDRVRTDLSKFESMLTLARADAPPRTRADALQAALAAYGGPFLAGQEGAWILAERAGLAEQHHTAALALARAWEEAGQIHDALEVLLRAEARDDRSEETQAWAMRLFLASGRAEAGARHFYAWERQRLSSTGRRPPPHLLRLADELRRAAGREAAPPATGLRAWVAGDGDPAAEADLLLRGARADGEGLCAWFGSLDDAMAAARALRDRGLRVAVEVAPPDQGAARVRALLRRDATAAWVVGEAAAALLGQGAPTTAAPPPALPRDPPLVGRDEALQALRAQATPGALATICGIGGIGKTALARALLAHDAGCFVDLSAARDRGGVAHALADALGVERRGDPLDGARRRLGGLGRIRVVLDNAEQVREPVAWILGRLRPEFPDIAWVVTSRAPLALPGEQVLTLDGLALPRGAPAVAELAAVPSVALFVARASAQDPMFQLTPANAPTLAALVTALEGIPLAIELAASRIRGWDPSALLARLEAQTLDVLAWQARPGPARQSTVRAALAWSWGLLLPWERTVLVQVSVFVGGLTEEAAAAVLDPRRPRAAPPLRALLDGLVRHSLLRRSGAGPTARYHLFRVLEEYAWERLAEPSAAPPLTGPRARAALERRHATWYAQLGGLPALDALEGADGPLALERLRVERGNLRAAAIWAAEARDGALLLGATRALVELAVHQGGCDDLDGLVAQVPSCPEVDPLDAAELRVSYAFARLLHHDDRGASAEVSALATQVLAQPSPTRQDARILRRAALHLLHLGQIDAAGPLAQAACDAARSPIDRVGALTSLGYVAACRGQTRRSTAINQELVDLTLSLGLPMRRAEAQIGLLFDLVELRALDAARALATALLSQPEASGGVRYAIWLRLAVAGLALHEGALDEAEACCAAAAALEVESGVRTRAAHTEDTLAEIAARRGDWARAAALRAPWLGRTWVAPDAWTLQSTPWILARAGRAAEGIALGRSIVATLEAARFRSPTDAWLSLGLALEAGGDGDGAAHAWTQARTLPTPERPHPAEVLASGFLSEHALARGALEQAATLVQTTRDLGHLQLRGEEAGLCAGWQGRLAAAQGERAVAEGLLARAQAIHRGLGAGEDSELGRLIGRLVGDLGAG